MVYLPPNTGGLLNKGSTELGSYEKTTQKAILCFNWPELTHHIRQVINNHFLGLCYGFWSIYQWVNLKFLSSLIRRLLWGSWTGILQSSCGMRNGWSEFFNMSSMWCNYLHVMSYNYKDVHTVMFKAPKLSFYEHPTYSSVIYW